MQGLCSKWLLRMQWGLLPSLSVILSTSKDILQVNKGKEKYLPIWERLVFAGVGKS